MTLYPEFFRQYEEARRRALEISMAMAHVELPGAQLTADGKISRVYVQNDEGYTITFEEDAVEVRLALNWFEDQGRINSHDRRVYRFPAVYMNDPDWKRRWLAHMITLPEPPDWTRELDIEALV